MLSTEISAGAGFTSKGQDLQTWLERNQPGAFAEYEVNIVEAGICGLAILYWQAPAGIELDLYVDGALIGKAVTAKNANEEARVPNAFRQFTLGRHKIKLVTGAQAGALELRGVQVNCPGDPLANLGRIQALSPTATTTLQLDSAVDFYRLSLDPIKSEKYWACVWTFCFFEFLVSSEKPASFELTMKYIQQSNENHACVGYNVNGLQQATLDMNGGTGRTTPKTIVVPAGTSRLRISNINYFKDVFCFGGSYTDIQLKPVSM